MVLVKFDVAYSLVDVGFMVFDRIYLESFTPLVETPLIGLEADETPESSDCAEPPSFCVLFVDVSPLAKAIFSRNSRSLRATSLISS